MTTVLWMDNAYRYNATNIKFLMDKIVLIAVIFFIDAIPAIYYNAILVLITINLIRMNAFVMMSLYHIRINAMQKSIGA